MRPRKIILLVDPVEHTRRERTFLLDNWGFRPLPFATPAQAAALLSQPLDPLVALLVASGPRHRTKAYRLFLAEAQAAHPGLRILVLSHDSPPLNNATFLEQVKNYTALKRGPKKQIAASLQEAAPCPA